jgi:hypothetical protein
MCRQDGDISRRRRVRNPSKSALPTSLESAESRSYHGMVVSVLTWCQVVIRSSRHQIPISLNCVFDASLVPGTCLHRFVDLKGFIQQVPGEP